MSEVETLKQVVKDQASIIDEIARRFDQNKLKELVSTVKLENNDIKNIFFSNIDVVKSGCHEWIGYVNPGGYGQLAFNGKSYPAHRISCALFKDKFYDFMIVDHVCRNRKCVNPEHLRLVGTLENAIGNSNSTAAHHSRKLYCKQGHPLFGENLLFKSQDHGRRKHRMCKICMLDQREKRKLKEKYFRTKESQVTGGENERSN